MMIKLIPIKRIYKKARINQLKERMVSKATTRKHKKTMNHWTKIITRNWQKVKRKMVKIKTRFKTKKVKRQIMQKRVRKQLMMKTKQIILRMTTMNFWMITVNNIFVKKKACKLMILKQKIQNPKMISPIMKLYQKKTIVKHNIMKMISLNHKMIVNKLTIIIMSLSIKETMMVQTKINNKISSLRTW